LKTYSKILILVLKQVELLSKHLFFVIGISLLIPLPAAAYLCAQVDPAIDDRDASSLSWSSRKVVFAISGEGTTHIDNEIEALSQSLNVWEFAQGCAPPNAQTDFDFELTAEPSPHSNIGYNFMPDTANENLLIFRDNDWPHPGTLNFQFALTTTTYMALTGEILDADIEFNTAGIPFNLAPQPSEADLISVAVHELGHALGLDHSDNPQATMFAQYIPGTTDLRSLHCDDHNGMTFKYPKNLPSGYCEPGDSNCPNCFPPLPLTATVTIEATESGEGGGCSCQNQSPEATWILLLFLLVAKKLRLYRRECACHSTACGN